MPRCSIGFSIEDSCTSVVAFLQALRQPLDARNLADWEIDLSSCRYLGPDAVAILAALALRCRHGGRSLRMTLPQEPPALRAFCSFSGLRQLAGFDDPPNPDHPQNETAPIRNFMRASLSAADPVVRLLQRHVDLGPTGEDYIRLCMNEVAQNIEDHASSPIGGVCCARFLTNQREVRVAICDMGAGIEATLRTRIPDVRSAREALRMVIEGGYTSMSRPRNRGLGIENIHRTVQSLRGELVIISGDAAIDVRRGRAPTTRRMDVTFPGTGVFFTLPVLPRTAEEAPERD